MKVRANTSGVYTPAGFFSLREGQEYDVTEDVATKLLAAGVADAVEDAEPKPARGKKISAAPENKAS